MKLFKKILVTALSAAVALSVFTGCSQTSKYTIEGTMTMRVNGEQVVVDAPVTMASDGSSSYAKYEINGTTIEGLTVGSDYYERAYTTGTTDAKWTKTASTISAVASDAEVKYGTMVIDGTEYQTQTYDNVNFYCMDGNDLKYLYSKDGSEEFLIKITSISATADASLFTVPDASQIESAN